MGGPARGVDGSPLGVMGGPFDEGVSRRGVVPFSFLSSFFRGGGNRNLGRLLVVRGEVWVLGDGGRNIRRVGVGRDVVVDDMVNLGDGDGLDSSGGALFDKALALPLKAVVVVWFVMRGVVGLAGASDFLGDGGGVARCIGGAVF
jgi:hypothetical protein